MHKWMNEWMKCEWEWMSEEWVSECQWRVYGMDTNSIINQQCPVQVNVSSVLLLLSLLSCSTPFIAALCGASGNGFTVDLSPLTRTGNEYVFFWIEIGLGMHWNWILWIWSSSIRRIEAILVLFVLFVCFVCLFCLFVCCFVAVCSELITCCNRVKQPLGISMSVLELLRTTGTSIQFNSIQFNSIQFNSIQFNSIQSFTWWS